MPGAILDTYEVGRLQWGHVFSDVEIFRVTITAYVPGWASMGPRLFRRGNQPATRPDRPCKRCFNGATSFQTWKSLFLHFGIGSKGICFNGATSFQTWKLEDRPTPSEPRPRFNGATSFQTWKFHLKRCRRIAILGFNGATSFQTWKSGRLSRPDGRDGGFNGATSFQTWK